jgi:hypothetical protein
MLLLTKVGINALYTLQAAFDARLKENRGMDYIAKWVFKEDPAGFLAITLI